jgi:hypothetical protein
MDRPLPPLTMEELQRRIVALQQESKRLKEEREALEQESKRLKEERREREALELENKRENEALKQEKEASISRISSLEALKRENEALKRQIEQTSVKKLLNNIPRMRTNEACKSFMISNNVAQQQVMEYREKLANYQQACKTTQQQTLQPPENFEFHEPAQIENTDIPDQRLLDSIDINVRDGIDARNNHLDGIAISSRWLFLVSIKVHTSEAQLMGDTQRMHPQRGTICSRHLYSINGYRQGPC